MSITNDKTILQFPTYKEFTNIYDHKIVNPVGFSLKIKNSKDSNFVFKINEFAIYPSSSDYKSKISLKYDDMVYETSVLFGKPEMFTSKTENYLFLILEIPNNYDKQTFDSTSYETLKNNIYLAARHGQLIYYPEEEDYEKYINSDFYFLKEPYNILRDTNNIIIEEYYKKVKDYKNYTGW